jgi:hypothetical protein
MIGKSSAYVHEKNLTNLWSKIANRQNQDIRYTYIISKRQIFSITFRHDMTFSHVQKPLR